MRLRAAGLIATAVLAAACTGAPEGPSGALSTLPAPVHGERLLVLMEDGAVVTVSPDGSQMRSVVPSPGQGVEVKQPVWSPDGRSIAWAEFEVDDAGAHSRVVTSDPEGASRTEFAVETGTFFLQWDPTSSRVAYLGNYRGAVGMGVAELAADGSPTAMTLGAGRPFYLSWSPDGDLLLIHVGSQTLGTLDLQGNLEEIGDAPGIFGAPVWLADGRMVYAVIDEQRQTLVVRDDDTPKELVRFRGAIEFVVSPDGERIAYRVTGRDGPGGVSVVNIRSAKSQKATATTTSAFHWSPDGRRLLLMTAAGPGPSAMHRWQVWEDGELTPVGPTFLPSETFLQEYVPFYGQYAQAMTLWAPDGRSFAFPGSIGTEAGIWVQELSERDPTLVLDGGSVVAWSPLAV
jgi:Tol biopolymer transport system component